ncbi:hypothetical protein HRD49_23185 [Corallococcus exiguus]|uniref:hypothetical protein n=1 Tax=Corallococcus TaxID=83461 RepID=UPI000EA0CBE1|nr:MULTISPECIES: hypothetical protein [Corallococcus]NNC19471.1 hypothetical protein [Corallococcus exiguus]NRD56849.1 hypothetical protein [Corallococcus exiguus]NRD64661.1 hypothetical protein [Corallococcus exiguus]RKH17942.1 hypothetical protein D7V77_34975 [Corallococcus sp. CA041A]RUO88742.1 hypothetical protein D7Y11_33900 [Corallococcus sp. AB018]
MIALTWTYGQLLKGLTERVRRVLLVQVLILAPSFGVLELDPWGPSHRGLSLTRLALWGCAVGLLWALHRYAFGRSRVASWQRVVWVTALCWLGQWLGGFVALEALPRSLQQWSEARWIHVGFTVLFFWAATALLYRLAAPMPEPEAVPAAPTGPQAPSGKKRFTRAERPAGA